MLKLSDALLYPRELYARFTNRKPSLYAGILFVGWVDLFLPDIFGNIKALFTGKSSNEVLLNLLLTTIVVVLLGIVDVVVFALPLYDFFNYIKKRAGESHNATAVKVMKIYISSYFILLPIQLLLYYTVFHNLNENSGDLLLNLYTVYFVGILFWSTALISRGLNTLFGLNSLLRSLAFVLVLLWNIVNVVVFSSQLFPWIMKIFSLTSVTLPLH